MFIPEGEAQLAFADLQLDFNVAQLQSIPNVTKEISDILKLCDSAGLDPHGLGCGMSIAFVLTLAAALSIAVFVVLIPAIAGLVVVVFKVIGISIAAFVAGVTAAFIAVVAAITTLVAIVSRTIVKIVSLPFRPCLRNQDPVSPLEDNSEAGGVVNGQIHYSRQEEIITRPPSYSSDEGTSQIQSGKVFPTG